MTNKQTTPLWRELNEKRTQQIWECHANNEIHPKSDEDGVFIIADFSNFDIDMSVPKSEQAANAQYTALAVNNLHKLAEALEWIQNEIKTTPDELADALQGVILIKIKQTLAAIS